MSSGGRSAEQQAVAEHNLEGQHQALLQELRDECGKDCKRPHRHTFNFAPPCANPVMDENLTRNAQLSVLEQSSRPCRREQQHQPVELVIVVNADDEGKLALLEEQVTSLQRKLADSSRCKVAKQLRAQLAESEAAVVVQRSRALWPQRSRSPPCRASLTTRCSS